MKVTAALSPATGKPFEIDEVDLEEPRFDEVLVKISATGLCHTDLLFKDHLPIPIPAVFGHEGAGIVEKVGQGVTTVKPGDHVALSFNYCGKCSRCLAGMPYYCENNFILNYSGARADGSMPISKGGMPVFGCFFGQSSFATYSLATERNLVKVPHDVPLEILGPLGCGIQTGAGTVMNALKAETGSSIVVFGTGAVGLSAVMAAKVIGCTTIIGVDIKPGRLELAKKFGATHVVNPAEKNSVEEIRGITGLGVNYAVETTGSPAVYRQAVESLAAHGRCALLGASPPGTEVSFDMNTLLTDGKGTFGVIEGEAIPQVFIPKLIALYKQGLFPFDQLIKLYDMKDINQAVHDSEAGGTIKPVIRFNS